MLNKKLLSSVILLSFCACNSDVLGNDAFNVKLKQGYLEDTLRQTHRYPLYLYITSKLDDIKITKIEANRGNCKVYDNNYKGVLSNQLISSNTPPSLCYKDIKEKIGNITKWDTFGCGGMLIQYKLAKKYNKYYKGGLNDNGELGYYAYMYRQTLLNKDVK